MANRMYCDDVECGLFAGTDIQNCDWGYLMPKICRIKWKSKSKEKEK